VAYGAERRSEAVADLPRRGQVTLEKVQIIKYVQGTGKDAAGQGE
jgi:hypothetical protein